MRGVGRRRQGGSAAIVSCSRSSSGLMLWLAESACMFQLCTLTADKCGTLQESCSEWGAWMYFVMQCKIIQTKFSIVGPQILDIVILLLLCK